MKKNNFIIITGGPGVGKTTLLNELQLQGFDFVAEGAREIIRQQMACGGDALPWKNKEQYSGLMLDHAINAYASALDSSREKILFFDRGIPDTLAYCRLVSIAVSSSLASAAMHYRYHQKVFILPPWKEIYTTDNERKQDFDEAVETFNVLSRTYRDLNYETIEVPKMKVRERADFVLNQLKDLPPTSRFLQNFKDR